MIRTHMLWMVDICMSLILKPLRRDFISLAALLVKVMAQTEAGGAPVLRMDSILAMRQRVLPLPAEAFTRVGEGAWMARSCSSLSAIPYYSGIVSGIKYYVPADELFLVKNTHMAGYRRSHRR